MRRSPDIIKIYLFYADGKIYLLLGPGLAAKAESPASAPAGDPGEAAPALVTMHDGPRRKYSDHVRCGCRDPDGKQLGRLCPQLWRKDAAWNTRHGAAGFIGRIGTSAGVKQLKRFGYPSREAAEEAAQHVGKLLGLGREPGRA
jgi:hypothetical protein